MLLVVFGLVRRLKSTLNYLFNFNDEIYADTGFVVHEKERMESRTCRNSILGILE